MAGTSSNQFQGIFDGDNNTLTFTKGTSAEPFAEEYCAPFRHVKNAGIKNLHVAGTIYTSAKKAAGIVGESHGALTLTGCRSSIAINSSISGDSKDGTHGGLVSTLSGKGNTITIEGCVFDGSFATTNGTNNCGGFIGWGVYNKPTIKNSLMKPGSVAGSVAAGMLNSTFARWYTGNEGIYEPTIDNCYYVATTNLPTDQGTAAYATAITPANPDYDYGMVKAYKNCIWFDGNYYVKNTFVLTESAAAGVTELIDYAGATDQLVSFTRSGLTANAYSTMCLPFSFSAPSACTFYAFTGIGWNSSNQQWEATISQQDANATLSAHTPYIFKCAETEATFTGTIATVAASYGDTDLNTGAVDASDGDDRNWKFKGTYTALDWTSAAPTEPTYGFSTYVPYDEGNTAGIAAGTFVRFVQGASLAPFRARLIYSGENTHLKGPVRGSGNDNDILPRYIVVRIINNNGTITTVGAIDTETGEITNDAWFTLEGKMLTGEPTESGIYIYKGQKVSISK